jgi:hypothetical protein
MSPKHSYQTLAATSLLIAAVAFAGPSFEGSGGVDQSYDTNVDQYDYGQAGDRESAVTRAWTRLGLTYNFDNVSLKADYLPEYSWYWDAGSEDFFKHALNGKIGLKQGAWQIDSTTTLVHVDGSDEGLFFFGQGGAPCFGGVAVRDRRDQWLGRENLSIKYTIDKAFVRGVGSVYYHDFMTEQRSTPFYQNYADRSEYVGGIDFGYTILPKTAVYTGYRYGQQYQDEVLDNPIDYSNCFHRVVVGIEGQPTDWLSVNFVAGPDFRNLGPDVPAGADDTFTRTYFDGSIGVKLGDRDDIKFIARRFDQPGFGGRGLYTDSTYNIRYTHRFTDKLSASLDGRLIGCEFERPAKRHDWIYTTGISVAYKVAEHFTVGAAYAYEWGESEVRDTDAREFTRNMFTVSASVAF